MSNKGASVIEWVNTFEDLEIESLDPLYSGQLMGKMLSTLAPSFFGDLQNIGDTSENWALSASTLKKLLRSLEEYYKNALEKGITDLHDIDVNAIAKDHDEDMLLSLLEIIVGVAVLCEDKSDFIQKIFSLEESSQLVLKEMVENVMQRVYDLEDDEEDDDDEEDNGAEDYQSGEVVNELLATAQEAISELKAENQHLVQNVSTLTSDNNSLKKELDQLREDEFQKDVSRDNDRSRAEANANAQSTLQHSFDEVQSQLRSITQDNNVLTQKLEGATQQLEEHELHRAKLELQVLQMSDEVDLARDKALKLSKAENTIEKYQQKMEGLSALKNENKELEENLMRYDEKIRDLEGDVKTAQSTAKMVENYKDKSVVLEREKFEAVSALEMKDDEIIRLQSDLANAVKEKNSLEEDLVSSTAQLEMAENELADSRGQGGIFETPAALKEKIRSLELQVRKCQAASSSVDEGKQDARSKSDEGDGGQEDLSSMIDVLKAELEVSQTAKKEREDSLVAVKRQLAEANHELKKARETGEQRAEKKVSEEEAARVQAAAKDMEMQLAIKVNAVAHLEDLLKENETKYNKMQHDKEKLEIFAKRSMTSFKDKYMTALQRYKGEKVLLEEKLLEANEKLESEQNKHRKEERLMISAVYEMGVSVMEKNINLQIHESAATPSTYLGLQRAEQAARMTPRGKGAPPTTPLRR